MYSYLSTLYPTCLRGTLGRLMRSCDADPLPRHFSSPQPPLINHTPFHTIATRFPAMQTWRRTFATSVARLGSSTISSPRPAILRCAQILQSSKQEQPCSLEDQEIKVNGFIRSVRKQKRFAFAEISDGSTIQPLQAILKPAQAAEYVNPQEL